MFLISEKGWTSNLYWERELKSYVLPIRVISGGGRARNIKLRSLWNEKFNPKEPKLLTQTLHTSNNSKEKNVKHNIIRLIEMKYELFVFKVM